MRLIAALCGLSLSGCWLLGSGAIKQPQRLAEVETRQMAVVFGGEAYDPDGLYVCGTLDGRFVCSDYAEFIRQANE